MAINIKQKFKLWKAIKLMHILLLLLTTGKIKQGGFEEQ